MNEQQIMMMERAFREKLAAHCQACGLPRQMWESLIEYTMTGRPLGSFLAAVVTNDLMQAIKRADDLNIQRLRDYVTWLESVAPIGSFGSTAAYDEWRISGGLIGRQHAARTRMLPATPEE